jgi:thiamine biosynthesis lipoprotein ApbE
VPAADGPFAVTVVAESATEAEAHATALAISPIDEAFDHVASRPGLSALLIPPLGEPIAVGRLPLARERPRPQLVVSTETGQFTWR